MPPSIDINSNRGLLSLLVMTAVVGGGASALQNQLFGPGGQWETVVTNQKVQAEQIKTGNVMVKELNSTLREGFDKLSEALKEGRDHRAVLSEKISINKHDIDTIEKQIDKINQLLATMQDNYNRYRKENP